MLRSSIVPMFILFSILGVTDARAQGQPTSNDRVRRILYDFDANGITDAIDDITYDAQGHAISANYVYTGDGTTDLLNTRDNNALFEDQTLGWNAEDLLVTADVDRGFERFLVTNTHSAGSPGQFSQVEVERFDAMGTSTGGTSSFFIYEFGVLAEINSFDVPSNNLLSQHAINYFATGLPREVDFISPTLSMDNSFVWRPDGQPVSTNSLAGGGLGSGSGVYSYDAQARPTMEVWTQTGVVGSLFSEFPGFDYRKTFGYDAFDRRVSEEIDLNDDGSLDAIITTEWEAGVCRQGYRWSPNGRPNFVEAPWFDFVQGSGISSLEYCPEPGFAVMSMVGVLGLALVSRHGRQGRSRIRTRGCAR